MARIWSYRAGLTGVVNEPSYRAQLPGKYKQAVITQYASRHVFMKGEKELSWQFEQPLRCSRTNAVRSRCVEPVQNFVARIAQRFQGRFLSEEGQMPVHVAAFQQRVLPQYGCTERSSDWPSTPTLRRATPDSGAGTGRPGRESDWSCAASTSRDRKSTRLNS